YYYDRAATGVHDDLHAKAIVLDDGATKVALVALDLISAPRAVVEAARDEVRKSLGIPGERVMVSATHAHTGPVLRDGSERASEAGASDLAGAYVRSLPGRIAEAVRLAAERLAPAKASAAIGREERIAFNRRFHMKDGSVGWNPGHLNPAIVRPAGPTDPKVPVVYFEAPDGKPLATYVNFAMHLDTVGGLEFSADYPYTLARLLGECRDPEMLTVFTIGTAGDVNHLKVAWAGQRGGHREAARLGTILAGAVLAAYTELAPLPEGRLRARSAVAKLPLAEVSPGDVDAARAVLARRGGADPPSFLELVQAYKVLDVAGRGGKPIEAEVQVVALGRGLAWVSLPGEIFVELGLAIQRASPFPTTIVVELANGSVGYVPTRAAWPQGNYEVVSARCGPGSGEILVEEAVRLLLALHAESAKED
ncbi:MAG: hypothetical protein ACUVYA_04145, partial [Planctomycetota bacterium]